MTYDDRDMHHTATIVAWRRRELGVSIATALSRLELDRSLRLLLEMYWHDLERKRRIPQGCIPHIANALGLEVRDLQAGTGGRSNPE